MEDPIKLDIWAKVMHSRKEKAIHYLRNNSTSQSELEIRKAINRSITKNEVILIAKSQKWSFSKDFRDTCDWLKEIQLCQEGYSPIEPMSFCSTHDFFFGGVMGCHICNHFFE